MIIDTLENAEKYFKLHPLFEKAFAYINAQNFETIETGKYEIDERNLHALVSLKNGLQKEEAKFEAHNNYIDIQVCLADAEQIGWKPRSKCVDPKEAYNVEKDVLFYNDLPDTYFQLHQPVCNFFSSRCACTNDRRGVNKKTGCKSEAVIKLNK